MKITKKPTTKAPTKAPTKKPTTKPTTKASPTTRDAWGAAVGTDTQKVHAALYRLKGKRMTKPDLLEYAGVGPGNNVLNGLTHQTFTSDRGEPVCDHTAEGYALTPAGMRAYRDGVPVLRTWQQTALAALLALRAAKKK